MSSSAVVCRASVVISVYENERWIAQQIESLLEQWRPDIDLVIIDDGSSDRSLQVALDAIATRPDVSAVVVRNDRRSGLAVIQQVLQLSKAEIIIQADSDDVSLPGRLDAIQSRFDADPECKLVTSNALRTSMEGLPIAIEDVEHDDCILKDPFDAVSKIFDVRWIGATSAFHRSLIEDFPLDTELCPYGLDLILGPRASLVGTHHYICEPLIEWRQHPRNTHRVEGALSTNNAVKDRYLYLELAAWAQRVRDIEHLLSTASASAVPEGLLEFARAKFMHQFAEWSLLHNEVISSGGRTAPTSGGATAISVPPIVTIAANTTRYFGASEVLGNAAGQWAGIFPPEDDWNWTGRRGLLVFRAPGARTIRVTLSGLLFLGEQSVSLRIGGGDWVSATLSGGISTVTLNIEPTHEPITLRIEAPSAVRPSQAGYNEDNRCLGVCLRSIEAIT